MFDLNLMGTILPCQVFGRQMAERGEGVILNFSSMNAFRPLTRASRPTPAAKAGVSNFTQWLAVHMAQNYAEQIRVNAIAPGFFLTEQNRFLLTDKETGELTARGRDDHRPHADGPLRQPGGPAGHGAVAALARCRVRHGDHRAGGRRLLGLQRGVDGNQDGVLAD